MATYEYQCSDPLCGAINERIQPMADERPEAIPCRFCGHPAAFKFSLPSIARSGMTASKTPHDVAVGRDADARWASIDKRQSERDKVRKRTQQTGLAAHGYRDFAPITDEGRQLRARAMTAYESFSP